MFWDSFVWGLVRAENILKKGTEERGMSSALGLGVRAFTTYLRGAHWFATPPLHAARCTSQPTNGVRAASDIGNRLLFDSTFGRSLTSVCQVRGAASVVSIAQARCALRATNAPSAGLIHIGAIRALNTSTKHGSKRDEEEYIKILDALKKTSLDRMDTPNKYQVSIRFFAFARENHRK